MTLQRGSFLGREVVGGAWRLIRQLAGQALEGSNQGIDKFLSGGFHANFILAEKEKVRGRHTPAP